MKKIAFYTLGCKVNQVETEQLKEEFIHRGYEIVDFTDEADVYLINTCTVTHVSDRKSRAVIRRAARVIPVLWWRLPVAWLRLPVKNWPVLKELTL